MLEGYENEFFIINTKCNQKDEKPRKIHDLQFWNGSVYIQTSLRAVIPKKR